LISDDPFSSAQRVLTDVVGRLQSGGAINKDEESRFLAMGPRPGDSDTIKQAKLKEQKVFLENKIRAMGVEPSSLASMGFDVGQADSVQGGTPTGPRITDATGINQSNLEITPPQIINQAMAKDPMQVQGVINQMTREQKLQYARQRGLIK